MEENLCTKYFPFTYRYVTLNQRPPKMEENLHIFFFIIGGVECTSWLPCIHLRLWLQLVIQVLKKAIVIQPFLLL